jgi:hypothetical protein
MLPSLPLPKQITPGHSPRPVPLEDSQITACREALRAIAEQIAEPSERQRFIEHTVTGFMSLLLAYKDPAKSKPIDWSKIQPPPRVVKFASLPDCDPSVHTTVLRKCVARVCARIVAR